MKILLDLDSVLADWNAHYDECLDGHGSAAAGIPRASRGEQRGWDLNEGLGPRQRAVVKEIMTRPGFYAQLKPIPGAKAAIRRLREAGHSVHIVTAPYLSNSTCASDKLAWIGKHLGHDLPALTVITNDKTLVRGDILVDDKPVITGSLEPDWQHVYFTQSWNQGLPGPRIDDWLTTDWLYTIDALESALCDDGDFA